MDTTDQVDRKLFKHWVSGLLAAIKPSQDIPELHVQPGGARVFDATHTDGWFAYVAKVEPRGHQIIAMCDRMSGRRSRMIWIGLFVKGRTPAIRIRRRLDIAGLKPLTLGKGGMHRDFNNHTKFKKPLSPADVGRPIVELYEAVDKGVGMYIDALGASARQSKASTDRAVRFLRELAGAITEQATPARVPGNRIVELRRMVVSTGSVRRDPKQALAAKVRDDFTCTLCHEKPEARYGVEGRACLEAHHLDEIGGRKSIQSTMDRLITVCANCHRFLHRLPKEERTLAALRQRLRHSRR